MEFRDRLLVEFSDKKWYLHDDTIYNVARSDDT